MSLMESTEKTPGWQKFEDATAARDRGDLDGAARLLQEILDEPDHSKLLVVSSLCVLGHLCWTNEDWQTASRYFAQATTIAPLHELSSLGLFHSLHTMGQVDEALEEGLRLLSLRDSQGYREMFVAGYEEGHSTRGQVLMTQIRSMLAARELEGK